MRLDLIILACRAGKRAAKIKGTSECAARRFSAGRKGAFGGTQKVRPFEHKDADGLRSNNTFHELAFLSF